MFQVQVHYNLKLVYTASHRDSGWHWQSLALSGTAARAPVTECTSSRVVTVPSLNLKELTDFPKNDQELEDPTEPEVFTDFHFWQRSIAHGAYH